VRDIVKRYTIMVRNMRGFVSFGTHRYFEIPVQRYTLIVKDTFVRSLSVSFFIEKEPHKKLRMKRKRRGER
jgi:hypothetical protein